jgi:ADP-heptose:LPS heptosyltransferase
MEKKRLVLRLSSLGDLILATSVLEVSSSGTSDWVVAREFAEIVRRHPKLNHVFEFDRKTQLKGWIQLSRRLWLNDYTEVIDLHLTLRTWTLKYLFKIWSFLEKKPNPTWKSISKQRGRLWSYYLLKSYFPKKWRPTPCVVKFTQLAGGSGNERPELTHLIKNLDTKDRPDIAAFQTIAPSLLAHHSSAADSPDLAKRGYICVMPSSRWTGKKWPVDSYFETLKRQSYFPVILGTKADAESVELSEKLSDAGVPHFSAVGKWNLSQTAWVLSQSKGYLGGDTGLAHLAEAVGVSALVLFGPTTPDMGFGPWRSQSRAIEIPLGCRPCGKDGRYCYRLTQKYECLKSLSPDRVLDELSAKSRK